MEPTMMVTSPDLIKTLEDENVRLRAEVGKLSGMLKSADDKIARQDIIIGDQNVKLLRFEYMLAFLKDEACQLCQSFEDLFDSIPDSVTYEMCERYVTVGEMLSIRKYRDCKHIERVKVKMNSLPL